MYLYKFIPWYIKINIKSKKYKTECSIAIYSLEVPEYCPHTWPRKSLVRNGLLYDTFQGCKILQLSPLP